MLQLAVLQMTRLASELWGNLKLLERLEDTLIMRS